MVSAIRVPSGESFGVGRGRGSLAAFHHERVHPRGLLEPVDGGDVRVIERRQRLGLALEPRQALGVGGEGVRQDLDGHLAAERGVGGTPDLPHSAFADLGGDIVNAEAGAGSEGHVPWIIRVPAGSTALE